MITIDTIMALITTFMCALTAFAAGVVLYVIHQRKNELS